MFKFPNLRLCSAEEDFHMVFPTKDTMLIHAMKPLFQVAIVDILIDKHPAGKYSEQARMLFKKNNPYAMKSFCKRTMTTLV